LNNSSADIPARLISFIVPAYNEETELPATLCALRQAAELDDGPYEVVVVDDGSTDATAATAEQHGARLVSIHRRQIAAARNAGAQSARGEIFVFVDADTHVRPEHVGGVRTALANGFAGGTARLAPDENVPWWGAALFRVFVTVYFGLKLGAGAFLFTTHENFLAVGGFDETYFAGEEVLFTLALRKLGRFQVLPEPAITSGRKMRLYPARALARHGIALALGGRGAVRSRHKLALWYEGARESQRN
jgi:glycosyltransferase involved in cell wall biosynthesis